MMLKPSHSRILIGFLITTILILGALLIAMRHLQGDLSETPPAQSSPKSPIGAPILPHGFPAPNPDQSLPKENVAKDPVKDVVTTPDREQPSTPSSPSASPFEGKSRVLPPIGDESEESEPSEYASEILSNPFVEEPLEEEPSEPLIPPEASPDFVR